jgi:hypothetical protein
METDDFDWGELPREWWIQTAVECGATEKHAKFAAAKHRGATNSDAARKAGFGGGSEASVRSEGYRLARSNKINQLLALATAEAGGGYDGTLTRAESKQILTSLARGSDPALRIKAIESLGKIEDGERGAASEAADDPDENLRNLICSLPESGLGAALALGCFFHGTGNIINFPHIRLVAPMVAKTHPVEWARWRKKHEPHWHSVIDEWAAGPVLSGEQIVAALTVDVPAKPKPITETADAD